MTDVVNTTNKIYESLPVYHPDGSLMFRGSSKRVNWYLSRGLATITEDGGCKLNFEPRGKGENMELLGAKEDPNMCCVCGVTDMLSKHHIVPYKIMKYYVQHNTRNRFNLVPVCRECHDTYERRAIHTYQEMIERVFAGDPYEALTLKHMRGSIQSLVKFSRPIHPLATPAAIERIYSSRQRALDIIVNSGLAEEIINKILDEELSKKKSSYNYIMSLLMSRMVKLVSYEECASFWSNDFVSVMKPKFLPQWWDLYYVDVLSGVLSKSK